MFERITIQLTGPICTCEEQDLAWGVTMDANDQPQLFVQCRECLTRLEIPNKKFRANFNLRVPYPGKKKETKVEQDGLAKVLKLVPMPEST